MERCTGIVADHDGASAIELKKALRTLQCDVVAVPDLEALDAAVKDHKTALLLLAESLPGLDVQGVCRQLHREHDRNYYVVILLDSYRPEKVSAAFEAGADEVLVKPLIPAELRARLEHAKRNVQLESLRSTVETESAWLAELAATRSIYSPRYLQEELENEIARSRRCAHPLALILADIHHDDTRIVRKLGHLLSAQVRSHVDWAARYGESRIALVLPETNLGGALRVAERLQAALDDTALRSVGLPTDISAIFGISAVGAESAIDAKALLDAAEAYLGDASLKGPKQIAGGPAPRSRLQ
jgi:diguanylate cyclase (GGDEF)-like protein